MTATDNTISFTRNAAVPERDTANGGDALPDPRYKLRSAVEAVKAEETKLQALENAQTKAHEQGWYVRTKLSEAEGELQRATKDEGTRLAYQFVNNRGELATLDPVAEARINLDLARREVTKIDTLETALADEITYVQTNLRQLRIRLHDAMGQFVATSPEYLHLIAEHRATWKRLRTIKCTLRSLIEGLHSGAPANLVDEVNLSEPLFERVELPH